MAAGDMRHMTRLAAFATAFFLAACATVAPLGPNNGVDVLAGRLALRVDPSGNEPARAFSAAFELRGDARSGALGLSTPLGSMLAQARWSPGDVALTTPQGSRSYADLDGLTRDVLGESVPVEAWFDWLRGRPWGAAPSTTATGAIGFEQLGWQVDLARLEAGAVSATRRSPLPVVTVRIQLDRS
jgi:outer membrane lipoprotein LolB